MDCTDGNWLQYGYNTVDQSTFLRYHFDGVTRTTAYTYTSPDNLPASTSFFGIGKVTNAYDSLTRPSSVTYKTDDDHNDVKAAYGYIDWSTDANRTTSTVRGIDYTFNTGLLSISDLYYTYDKAGNITAERVWTTDDNKPLREKYTYDQKNQLTRHDSKTQNATFVYTYGQAGNILSVKRYAYTTGTLGEVLETKTYTYGDSSWADLLTKYNGKAITYDGIGNMLTYNGATYTWMGRELRKITSGSNTYSYKYNADGIRTSKTVNGTTTEFFLNGSQVLAQKTGDSVMRFFYDSTGKRVGFANGTMLFYYLYNLQGDVIAIVRAATGQVVAKYSYDAWGKCTVTNAAGYTVGDKNPFRYRGYYYDTETGLYYLNSRYYNPEFGRFISVDTVMGVNSDISTYNLFAYCGNNPITRYDNGGMSWDSIVFIMHTLPYTLHGMNTIAVWIGIDTAAIGGSFLNMTKKGDTYHADFDCWQQYFGYNNFYDLVFNWATSCSPAKFKFAYNGKKYVIWTWKGDYINMGAGAEMGIYTGGGPHWQVDKSLAMSMCMHLQYNGKTIIEPYRDYTWWITGFNPQYLNTSAGSLTASFSIWFKDPGMFHAFRSSKPWGWSFGIMQGFYTASFTL